MEHRNKNILIGGLLAIVLVMAVGYAAFATQLNINGTAEITSKWDVHYNIGSATPGTATTDGVTATAGTLDGGATASTAPSGTITYSSDKLTATLAATLVQPGDSVVFTLTPHNYGTNLAATAGTPVVKISNAAITQSTPVTTSDETIGNIRYQVAFTKKTSIAAGADDNDITVTVSYVNPTANSVADTQTAYLSVSLQYTQAS